MWWRKENRPFSLLDNWELRYARRLERTAWWTRSPPRILKGDAKSYFDIAILALCYNPELHYTSGNFVTHWYRITHLIRHKKSIGSPSECKKSLFFWGQRKRHWIHRTGDPLFQKGEWSGWSSGAWAIIAADWTNRNVRQSEWSKLWWCIMLVAQLAKQIDCSLRISHNYDAANMPSYQGLRNVRKTNNEYLLSLCINKTSQAFSGELCYPFLARHRFTRHF